MAGCVIASRLLPCIQKEWDWFRSESLVSCLSFALTDVRNCGNLRDRSIGPWDSGTASAVECLRRPQSDKQWQAPSPLSYCCRYFTVAQKKNPLSTQSGKPGVLPQRQFGYRAPSSPCSAENTARLKPTHPGCVPAPTLTPGKFPSYEKGKNNKKKKIYAALCLVLCVCFAALRLENCSSKSSGSCDNVESSSSVTQQSADSQCYHSMSSIE